MQNYRVRDPDLIDPKEIIKEYHKLIHRKYLPPWAQTKLDLQIQLVYSFMIITRGNAAHAARLIGMQAHSLIERLSTWKAHGLDIRQLVKQQLTKISDTSDGIECDRRIGSVSLQGSTISIGNPGTVPQD